MDVDALVDFLRSDSFIQPDARFEQCAAALLALRSRAETAERVRDDTQARFLLRDKDACARLAEVVVLRNEVAALNGELAAASAGVKEVLRGQEMIDAKIRRLDALCQNLRAERDALREALERIAYNGTEILAKFETWSEAFVQQREIARAALAPAEQPAGKGPVTELTYEDLLNELRRRQQSGDPT